MPDRDLPEDLVLPLASGEPWWYWSGGRPAVDFVNTHRERWRRGVETLVTPGRPRDLAGPRRRDGRDPEPRARATVLEPGARPARGDRRAARRDDRRRAAAPAAAVTLVDDWLVFAGARPQLVVDRRRRAAAWPSAPRPTRRAARWAWSRWTPRRCSAPPSSAAGSGSARRETCSGRFFDRSPGGAAPLVLDAHLRQRGQGPPPPRAQRAATHFNNEQEQENDMSTMIEGRAVRPGGRRRLRDRDRRARQGRRRAALPRRRHRGPRRHRPLREGLGPARRRRLRPGPGARRAAPADDPQRRPARRRPGGDRRAGARVGPAAADRHHRRAGAQRPRPRVGHGAELRRAVRARPRQAVGPAGRRSTRAARSPSAS